MVFDHNEVQAAVFSRDLLFPGNRIPGPAVLVEDSSTIVIPPFASAALDGYGNVILEMAL